MAEADWTEASDGLSAGTIVRGVSAGITPPNGGGTFIFGFNSVGVTAGAVAYFTNQVNFAPMSKGGIITGAVQRGVSGGNLNFSPFLFIGLQGTSVTDTCYLLGLTDEYPHRIALRKGTLSGGVPAGAPGSLGILARSTSTVSPGTWKHLRLDMIVNVSGDVVLKCFESDLAAHAVTSPSWTAIAGISDFVDDRLYVATGSAPLLNGRAGFGFASADVSRRGYFDHLTCSRQL